MKKKMFLLCPLATLLILCVCRFGAKPNNHLAWVGSTLLTQEDADAFSMVRSYYPDPPEEFSLSARASTGALAEAQAVYRHERWKLASLKYRYSLEWKWKERYYTSFLFMENILKANLGYTDNQLKNYFQNHKAQFANVVSHDSGGKKWSDTVPVVFNDVKHNVAEKMFLASHKPDSAFLARIPVKDPEAVNREWLKYVWEGGFRDLFMKQYYREAYGKPCPDSLKDMVGPGKILSQKDLDVILSWLPSDRRQQFKSNPQGLASLSAWLIRWKLFSLKAADIGYASQPAVRNVLKWAWRFELTQHYYSTVLGPVAKRNVSLDTAMAKYSYWDETGTPASFDTAQFATHLKKLADRETRVKFDSLVYEIRRAAGVRFLKPEWSDDLVKDPKKLLRTADSLRDTGNSTEAENTYRALTENFPFLSEGKKAFVELAKIKTEQQMYLDAISNYRRMLTIDADKSKEYNTMFMIGFIYDEYLNKPELAEINYKWVLKNAPGCELADDAEFMMLHLGEQMANVDELQAEVKRQGKKVETSDADSSGLHVEATPGKLKKI